MKKLLNGKIITSEVEKFLNDNYESFLSDFKEEATVIIEKYVNSYKDGNITLREICEDIDDELCEVLYDIVSNQTVDYMHQVYLTSLYTDEDLVNATDELNEREETLMYKQIRRFLNGVERKALKIAEEISVNLNLITENGAFNLDKKAITSEVENFLNDNYKSFLDDFKEKITDRVNRYSNVYKEADIDLCEVFGDIKPEVVKILNSVIKNRTINHMYNVYLPSLYAGEKDLSEAKISLMCKEKSLIYKQVSEVFNKAKNQAFEITEEICNNLK